eukprot:g1179.t1
MGGKASSADYDFCKRSPKYVWMAANAGKFGFIRTVEKECWHWEYRPGEAAPSYQCAGTCPDTASAHDIAASNGHSAHDTAASNGHSEPTQEAGADTACSAAKIIHESRALEKEIKDRHGDAYGTSFDGYGTSGADKWVCSTWVAEILKRAGCPGGQGLSNDVNIVSFPPPLANAIRDDDNSIKGSVNALVSRGLGTEVPFDKLDTLVAGDLCQWWSSLSSGHSVIVAGPKFDGKWTITGSHKSKKGVFDMSVDLASYTGDSKRIYCVHPTASSPSTGIQEEIECKVPDNEGGFREGICATSSDCVGPLFELQPDRSSCKTSGEQCCVTSDDNRAHPGAEGGPEELDDIEEEKDDEIGDSTESAESDDVSMAPDTATCPENRRSTNVCMEVYGHSTCGEKQVTGSCGECARTIKEGSGVNWVCEPDENGGEKRGYIQDDPNHSSRQSPEPITRNEILKRGLTWINNRIRYSQRRYHFDPYVGQRYRTDCTGYVSMAWNIDQIGSTSWVRGIKDAGPDENKLFKSIACSELLPGDALVNNGHIVLFRKWSNKEAGQFYVWHESGSTSGTVQDLRHPPSNRRFVMSSKKRVHAKIDPVWMAMSKLRRRRYEEAIQCCTDVLEENPRDKAVWILKCRSLTLRDWVEDVDTVEEEGIGDLLLDDNVVASVPRPGTSLLRPMTSARIGQAVRPVDASGRPSTGFARPGTGSGRPATGAMTSRELQNAFKGNRPGTSRPATALGRQIRLGTASLVNTSSNDIFVDVEKLDMHRYARRPALGKVLCDYLLYHDQNPRKAVELCAAATKACCYGDWWWKARLGKSYYRLGLYQEAERQLKSSLKQRNMISTTLELSKIRAYKQDQPNSALKVLREALRVHPDDVDLLCNAARIHAIMNTTSASAATREGEHSKSVDVLSKSSIGDADERYESIRLYRQVLRQDPTSVEAISCLASHYFYTDRPEIALRFYRRLSQMGVNTVELWNNMGLCCFYSSHYDMAVPCFERAANLAEDDESAANVWYNIGHVGIGVGDLQLAYQSFRIASTLDPHHAEAANNLGVLELRRGQISNAKNSFESAQSMAPHVYESFYNAALLAFKMGDFQESFDRVSKSLHAFPEHTESKALMDCLKRQLRRI